MQDTVYVTRKFGFGTGHPVLLRSGIYRRRDKEYLQNIGGENLLEEEGGDGMIRVRILRKRIVRTAGERSLCSVAGLNILASGAAPRRPQCSATSGFEDNLFAVGGTEMTRKET
jgi:hypothetical protein